MLYYLLRKKIYMDKRRFEFVYYEGCEHEKIKEVEKKLSLPNADDENVQLSVRFIMEDGEKGEWVEKGTTPKGLSLKEYTRLLDSMEVALFGKFAASEATITYCPDFITLVKEPEDCSNSVGINLGENFEKLKNKVKDLEARVMILEAKVSTTPQLPYMPTYPAPDTIPPFTWPWVTYSSNETSSNPKVKKWKPNHTEDTRA